MSGLRTFWSRWRGLALLLALALAHALLFAGYVIDDAYISFRYARHLARGDGLVYNLGEHVEGYTNFLWVLLAALGDVLGIAAPLSMPVIGLACLLGLVAAVCRAGQQLGTGARWSGVAAALVVACHTGTAFYSVTGLETVLFSLWMTLAAVALVRAQALQFALLTCLAVLTRPEAGLLALIGVGCLMLRARSSSAVSRAEVALMLAFFIAIGATYAAFKLWYFGSLLPNTFLAKRPSLAGGLSYAFAGVGPLLGLFAVALVSARQRPAARGLLGLWVIYCVAIVLEGGDWMPAHRMFVPFVPMLALAADAELVQSWSAHSSRSRLMRIGCAAVLASYVLVQGIESKRLARLAAQTLAFDINRVKVAMYLHAGHVRSVAAHDIGLLGYVLDEVQILDLGGLVNRNIARGPGGYGNKRPALEYLQEQAPERILIATSAPQRIRGELRVSPVFPVEAYVQESRWFQTRYVHQTSFAVSATYHLHVFAAR